MTSPQELDDAFQAGIQRADVAKQWTTTPPTQPGWYWAWQDDDAPRIVFVGLVSGALYIVEYDHYMQPLAYTHWIGPLPVPAPPQ